MKGIILAAGRGSRLGAITDAHPKCLTPLLGRPLLHWQLESLRAAGVDEVAVVAGYRADTLRGGDYALFENPLWAETNMVASLACAAEWLLAEPVVISYSDIVFRPSTVRDLLRTPGEIALTCDTRWADLWGDRFEDPLADAESFRLESTRVVEIGSRVDTLAEIQAQFMGLLRFEPAGWELVAALLAGLSAAERDRLDMTSLLRRLIVAGADVRAAPVQGGWCEVDSESDLRLYERRIHEAALSGRPWSHDWRESEGW